MFLRILKNSSKYSILLIEIQNIFSFKQREKPKKIGYILFEHVCWGGGEIK